MSLRVYDVLLLGRYCDELFPLEANSRADMDCREVEAMLPPAVVVKLTELAASFVRFARPSNINTFHQKVSEFLAGHVTCLGSRASGTPKGNRFLWTNIPSTAVSKFDTAHFHQFHHSSIVQSSGGPKQLENVE